jgi:hypothetical protein
VNGAAARFGFPIATVVVLRASRYKAGGSKITPMLRISKVALAKPVLAGRFDDVIKTAERNIRLV